MVRTPIAQRRRGGFPLLELAGLLMILAATVLLVTQLSSFSSQRQEMPQGLTLAGVPVSNMSPDSAMASLEQVYGSPITVMYRDQEIRLSPDQIGFRIDSEAMLSRAEETHSAGTFWSGFWDYLWGRTEQGDSVDLIASYSQDQLNAWLADVADRYDRPPQAAEPALETMSFVEGKPGYQLDAAASAQLIDAALKRPTNRTVDLVVNQEAAPKPGLDTLQSMMVDYLVSQKYDGAASVQVIDLKTGDEMKFEMSFDQGNPSYLNCEIPYAAMSTMKIPIMVNFFRYLAWEPLPYEYDEVHAALVQSSNLNANFMLRDIGGGDMLRGAADVSQSMQDLGLLNTFTVGYYDETDPPTYYSTPAREAARAGTCVNTLPDAYMQTTAGDMASLMDMIYQCAEFDGGGLIAAYPDEITQKECQSMLDIMKENSEGRLILSGVPESVPVAHKHGYTTDTIGDVGIVFSPGGDYVMTVYMWANVGWIANIAFPLIQGLSTATFNYFNPDMVNVPRRGIPSNLVSPTTTNGGAGTQP